MSVTKVDWLAQKDLYRAVSVAAVVFVTIVAIAAITLICRQNNDVLKYSVIACVSVLHIGFLNFIYKKSKANDLFIDTQIEKITEKSQQSDRPQKASAVLSASQESDSPLNPPLPITPQPSIDPRDVDRHSYPLIPETLDSHPAKQILVDVLSEPASRFEKIRNLSDAKFESLLDAISKEIAYLDLVCAAPAKLFKAVAKRETLAKPHRFDKSFLIALGNVLPPASEATRALLFNSLFNNVAFCEIPEKHQYPECKEYRRKSLSLI